MCDLCLVENQKLVRSHIYPKFHYQKSGRCYQISNREYGGIKEDHAVHLFCGECDGKFGAVENLFIKWWRPLRLEISKIIGDRENIVNASGEWSCPANSERTIVTIKDADLNLLKKMMLINVFRQQCQFSALEHPGAIVLAKHFRSVVKQFLDCDKRKEPASIRECLAQFSIGGIYAHMPISGCVLPPLVRPFLGQLMGFSGDEQKSEFRCFIGPIVWTLYEHANCRVKGDIRMECHDYRDILPKYVIRNAREILS